MTLIVALVVAVLFGAGVQLMVRRDGFDLAAGTLLISNAAFLFIVSAGFEHTEPPILPLRGEQAADPLAQALALTGVVIGFATTVLLLRILLAVERSHGSIDLQALVQAEAREGREPSGDEGEAS